MAFNGFTAGIALRVMGLAVSLIVLALLAAQTQWYATMMILSGAALAQTVLLTRYAGRAGREVGRFLEAVAHDDTSASFSGLARQSGFAELGTAMTGMMEQLRRARAERAEQGQYLQNLIAHVPVALLVLDQGGDVRLLNLAARRLFGGACPHVDQLTRYGAGFAADMQSLKPGSGCIVRMERPGGALHLKASATDLILRGERQRLISLQNIDSELNAKELMAWQAVIRVTAHEVMNSLTPIASLAATTRDIIADARARPAADAAAQSDLADAAEALETLTRRSQGLLRFVENHRRLTRHLAANVQTMPVRRVFTRLHRLLAGELENLGITLAVIVEPDTLVVTADADLLDQALINLLRNAMDAVRGTQDAAITLAAGAVPDGRVAITVADNGPGIPADRREAVFVPFYTTKRQGSGVGLTLVRQIAAVHGAGVTISEAPGGGACIRLVF